MDPSDRLWDDGSPEAHLTQRFAALQEHLERLQRQIEAQEVRLTATQEKLTVARNLLHEISALVEHEQGDQDEPTRGPDPLP